MANALAMTLWCQDTGVGDVVFETHRSSDDESARFVYEGCAG